MTRPLALFVVAALASCAPAITSSGALGSGGGGGAAPAPVRLCPAARMGGGYRWDEIEPASQPIYLALDACACAGPCASVCLKPNPENGGPACGLSDPFAQSTTCDACIADPVLGCGAESTACDADGVPVVP